MLAEFICPASRKGPVRSAMTRVSWLGHSACLFTWQLLARRPRCLVHSSCSGLFCEIVLFACPNRHFRPAKQAFLKVEKAYFENLLACVPAGRGWVH